jgi:type II secretory pathway pseudopilin PulG
MNQNPTDSGTRGLTLLEVVIAGAVIAIALMGTIHAWMNAAHMQSLQREEAMAQAAITKVINDMRALPFSQISTAQTGNPPGFSGGTYPGDPDTDRLLPGRIKLYLGWTGIGIATDSSLRGVKVSPAQFPGGVKYGSRWWAPQANTPELRVVFINNELPVEARMGEDPLNPSDGVDLNQNGQIEQTAFAATTYEFGEVDAQSLFPRLLAVPVSNPPRAPISDYLNVSQMVVYPVVVQCRWWSAAGFPRELSVITFFTNRAGSTVPFNDVYVP